jgi:hypothetical protein
MFQDVYDSEYAPWQPTRLLESGEWVPSGEMKTPLPLRLKVGRLKNLKRDTRVVQQLLEMRSPNKNELARMLAREKGGTGATEEKKEKAQAAAEKQIERAIDNVIEYQRLMNVALIIDGGVTAEMIYVRDTEPAAGVRVLVRPLGGTKTK